MRHGEGESLGNFGPLQKDQPVKQIFFEKRKNYEVLGSPDEQVSKARCFLEELRETSKTK